MIKKIFLSLMVVMTLSACSELELGSHVAKQMKFPSDHEDRVGDFKVGNPYKIKGRTYQPSEKYRHSEVGVASWYGPGFDGKLTANGEIFRRNELTAAHKTLQMPSIARVTNLENGRSIIVRINDRGPFAHDRIIDLSEKAAEAIKMKRNGTARVRVDVLEKESRMVASAAKKGLSTRGTELALNRGRRLHGMEVAIAKPASKPTYSSPQPVTQSIRVADEALPVPQEKTFNRMIVQQASTAPIASAGRKPVQRVVISGQQANSVTSSVVQKPSIPTATAQKPIFIQTGAFTNEDNAMTMKMALYNIDEPVNIYRENKNGISVYKVKIGPVPSIEKADEILKLLNRQGRQAHMIVAQN